MKVKIYDLSYDIDCPGVYENINALVPLKGSRLDYSHPLINWVSVEDGESLWKSEEPVLTVNIWLHCNSIQINDDRLEIEFPDGTIGTFEIESDEWSKIEII